MKYYLIGTYPPPLGGVSVYIYRSKKMLEKLNYLPEAIDYSKMSRKAKFFWILKILTDRSNAVYNLNNLNLATMAALLLRPFPKKVILTVHSGHSIKNIPLLKRIVLKYFLPSVNELILVGEHLKNNFLESGYTLPQNISVKNSFLPPPLEEEEQILNSYDSDVMDFVCSHKPVIIANASKIAFYNNEDLYGLDLSVELTARLKTIFPKTGFVFALAVDNKETAYIKDIKKRISDLGLSENFLFMTGNKEIWPLFKKADLMIRPTNTDSFGISIAEALYMGCPAVASDVCIRPEGTILFRSRDINDLFEKAKKVLLNDQKM